MDLLAATTNITLAVRAAGWAARAFPDDPTLAEREKNLLARKYLADHPPEVDFRENLRDRARQQAAQRPVDAAARLDALEAQYRQSARLEDFREFVRAVREAPADRRDAAVPTLQDGHDRFGERDVLWLVREIRLGRRWAEVRVHAQLLAEKPDDPALAGDHDRLRRDVLREQVDHLYEIVSSLPPGPDRHRRELELAARLLDAGRFEEAVKQAQSARRRAENRTEALVLMAKAFVQLGLSMEAGACFEATLNEMAASPQTSPERLLEAKYSYAEFLTAQAEAKADPVLARQARRLCSEVLLDDIDFRSVRSLCARADAVLRTASHLSE